MTRTIALLFCALILHGCIFLPRQSLEDLGGPECTLFTSKLYLDVETFEYRHVCGGSDNVAVECLVGAGVGTFIVSGSIVVVGNTLHWLEYHGRCDEGAIQQGVALFKASFD